MHETQRRQTVDLLRTRGLERALFAHLDSVKWLTGFAPPIQLGAHPFAGGPPVVWYESGHFTLIVVDAYAADAQICAAPDLTVMTYPGYTIAEPIRAGERFSNALIDVLMRSNGAGKVGVELRYATGLTLRAMERALDGARFDPLDDALVSLRMIKTDEELAKLRHNFALSDIGHAAARQAVRVGAREIDVWTELQSAINRAAGCRVPLGNDCTAGDRRANIGAWPGDWTLREGSSIIVDIGTVHQGYWSDSCATYYAGERTTKQEELHHIITQALEYAISLVHPGVRASEIDRQVRAFIERTGHPVYPHHTGHGVGVALHEEPRIVPYNDTVLEPGMVILLEPGIYYPGETGVRLEDAMLVTADGVQLLTHHDKS